MCMRGVAYLKVKGFGRNESFLQLLQQLLARVLLQTLLHTLPQALQGAGRSKQCRVCADNKGM